MIKNFVSKVELGEKISQVLHNEFKASAITFNKLLVINADNGSHIVTIMAVSADRTFPFVTIHYMDQHLGRWVLLKHDLVYAQLILERILEHIKAELQTKL